MAGAFKCRSSIATNIVPKKVVLDGEARSHDDDKLEAATKNMSDAVKRAVEESATENATENGVASYEEDIEREYNSFHIPEDNPLIARCKEAANEMERELNVHAAGGGSDANIFNANGIVSVIFSAGMANVHTVNENIAIDDLHLNALLLFNSLKTCI
ncbi:M20/M25/M40 family metallo-hydrolase [Thermodesulfobacteriota bacterium]